MIAAEIEDNNKDMNTNLRIRLSAWALSLLLLSPVAAYAQENNVAVADLQRAIGLLDSTYAKCFTGSNNNLKMYDTYDLKSKRGGGTADVWPYTAALEATNSVLEALEALKQEAPNLYEKYHAKYVGQLRVLYDNLAYYRGSYTLISYASVRRWSIYGVHRASTKERATVTGIENVYDDQMWLIRELMRAYKLTGTAEYLHEAQYLADYVIDGWDCLRDANGEEYGGITWGPGYNSKHACSNAPIVQPLVWLYEASATEDEKADYTYYYCDASNKRVSTTTKRSEVYLAFAKKIYAWQKKYLLKPSGVYWDMMGGVTGAIQYEKEGTTTYRAHVDVGNPGGTAYTYNSGTMLSGAAELYRVTGDDSYRADLVSLSRATWQVFAHMVKRINGVAYYQYPIDESATNGFNTWFDNVLMRAYWDALPYNGVFSAKCLIYFQQDLDYGFEHYLSDGFLPIDLIKGWKSDTVTKGFHQLAFAAEYAILAQWQKKTATAIVLPKAGKTSPEGNVYGLDGTLIQRKATSRDVARLPHGLYIVGSRKLLR